MPDHVPNAGHPRKCLHEKVTDLHSVSDAGNPAVQGDQQDVDRDALGKELCAGTWIPFSVDFTLLASIDSLRRLYILKNPGKESIRVKVTFV